MVIVQMNVLGLPRWDPLTPRTWNTCGPSESRRTLFGEEHSTQRPLSSAHSELGAPRGSQPNVAVRETQGLSGTVVITGRGTTFEGTGVRGVTMSQLYAATSPWLPVLSRPRTLNVCDARFKLT